MSDKTSFKPGAEESDNGSGNVLARADDESRAAAAEIEQVAREIGKVDSATPDDTDDPDAIPMLTDVLPGAGAAASGKAADAPVEPAKANDGAPPDNMSEEDWYRMALKVQKSVMKSMLRRTDELVDGTLRDQLDEFLDRSAERLMADLKSTMEQAVREAVSRAIAEELSAVRKQIKKS